MIKAFIDGAERIVFNPFFLIPPLVATFINTIILFLAADSYYALITETLIFGNVPDVSLLELPFFLLTSYFAEILMILFAATIGMALGFYLIFVYTDLLKGEGVNVMGAIVNNLFRFTELVGVAIFFAFAGFLWGFVFYLLLILSLSIELVGIVAFILLLLWMLFGGYVYIKIIYAPVIMAKDREKLKSALALSWKWSENRFGGLAIFLFALTVISTFFSSVFVAVAELFENELIFLLLIIIGLGLAGAYYNVVFVKYYLNSEE